MRFATTWWMRSGSARAVSSGGERRRAGPYGCGAEPEACPLALAGWPARAADVRPDRERRWRSATTPLSSRDRSSSVGDQPAEPFGLGQGRTQRRGIGVGDAVDDVLQQRLQRGDRRAQLVRDVRDQLAPRAVGGGQVGGHRVERAGQLADLVAARSRAPGGCSRRAPSRRRPRSSRAAARSCRGPATCVISSATTIAMTAMKRSAAAVRVRAAAARLATRTASTTSAPSLVLIERRVGRPPQRLLTRTRRAGGPAAHGVGGLQGVADAVHRADQVGAELAAQRLDVAVHRARAGRVGPAPHLGQQLLARRAPRAGGRARQTRRSNSVGVRCTPRRRRAHPPLRRVDLQLAEPQDAARAARRRRGPLHPAQQRVHPGDQLAHARTAWSCSRRRRPPSPTSRSVSSSRAVSISTGTGRSACIAAAHLQAVEAGQHHVEHHAGRAARPRRCRRPPGRRRRSPRGSPRRAAGPRPPRRWSVVLDHQDPALRARGRRRAVVGCVGLLHRPPLSCFPESVG